jgi:hypothetical protein
VQFLQIGENRIGTNNWILGSQIGWARRWAEAGQELTLPHRVQMTEKGTFKPPRTLGSIRDPDLIQHR